MFCAESGRAGVALPARLGLLLLLLTTLWCSLAIFWTADTDECGKLFGRLRPTNLHSWYKRCSQVLRAN